MTMPLRSLALTAMLALAACAPPQTEPVEPAASPITADTPEPASPGPAPADAEPGDSAAAVSVIALDGEGLRLFDSETGSASALPFETPMDRTLAVLTAHRGVPAERGVNEDSAAMLST